MPGDCVKVKESTDDGSSIYPFGWQSISVGRLLGCLSTKLQIQCLPGCELVCNRWIILQEMGKDIKNV